VSSLFPTGKRTPPSRWNAPAQDREAAMFGHFDDSSHEPDNIPIIVVAH
jgi:hypothetical protein